MKLKIQFTVKIFFCLRANLHSPGYEGVFSCSWFTSLKGLILLESLSASVLSSSVLHCTIPLDLDEEYQPQQWLQCLCIVFRFWVFFPPQSHKSFCTNMQLFVILQSVITSQTTACLSMHSVLSSTRTVPGSESNHAIQCTCSQASSWLIS